MFPLRMGDTRQLLLRCSNTTLHGLAGSNNRKKPYSRLDSAGIVHLRPAYYDELDAGVAHVSYFSLSMREIKLTIFPYISKQRRELDFTWLKTRNWLLRLVLVFRMNGKSWVIFILLRQLDSCPKYLLVLHLKHRSNRAISTMVKQRTT